MYQSKSMFKAIIYDMDGLLIDSMIYWMKDIKEFLAKRGIELTPEIAKFFTGKGVKESMAWLKKEYNLPETLEELCIDKHSRIEKVYHELCQPMPGADNLIKKAFRQGMKQVIATGAPLRFAQIIAERFSWNDYLDYLTAVDQVGHIGKPDPKVFLHAASLVGVEPSECVVLEDAENGILAAKAAGMKCVAVPDDRWSWSVGDSSGADLIVNSLEDEEVLKYLNL